jgi:hypothetical protein
MRDLLLTTTNMAAMTSHTTERIKFDCNFVLFFFKYHFCPVDRTDLLSWELHSFYLLYW